MPRRSISTTDPEPDPLILFAATWLACGLVLLGLTPLPWRDATLGWSPAFWLLAAPCLLLIARRAFPSRAREASRRPRRATQRANAQVIRRRKIGSRPGKSTRRAAA